MQSGCFDRQGTKVDSTEECGQIISTPRRVKQGSVVLSPSRVDPPSILKSQHSPAGLKSSSPVNSGSLFPIVHGRLSRVLFRVISSQGLITGLSSTKNHGRPPSEKFLQSPAEFIIIIPSGIHHQESSTGLASKLRPSISSTEQFSGRPSRIYFPKAKLQSINISHFHTSCLHTWWNACNTISCWTSWYHAYHTSWHCMQLTFFAFSGKRQSQKQLPSTVIIPDSIPVSSQGTSESDHVSRFDSCI